jgi:hypothetical protein
MNSQSKRARNEADAGQSKPQQLLFANAQLQELVHMRHCEESELLPLMLAHGLVRRVIIIEITIQPLGGDSFKISVDSSVDSALTSVKEVKLEIFRSQGIAEERQELYKVALSADGSAVREDDAEPDLLEDGDVKLKEADVLTLAVKEEDPLIWRTYPDDLIELSDEGGLAEYKQELREAEPSNPLDPLDPEETFALVTSGLLLTKGTHYWEVVCNMYVSCFVGVCRPDLDAKGDYSEGDDAKGECWFIGQHSGHLTNFVAYEAEDHPDLATEDGDPLIDEGDRIGVLLNLDNGSLRFFKNGVPIGPGYPVGSVTGPVVHAVHMNYSSCAAQLLSDAALPARYMY